MEVLSQELKPDPVAHQGLVRAIAAEYRYSKAEYDDLVSEANLALLRACEKFDPDRGVEFSTFAYKVVRSHLSHFAGTTGRRGPIRVPAHVLQLMRRAARGEVSGLELTPGQRESLEAGKMAIEGETVNFVEHLPAAPVADEREIDPIVPALRSRLGTLPPSWRYVIERCYGLDGEPPGDNARIARTLGVSRERVRQIRQSAIRKLRASLLTEGGRDRRACREHTTRRPLGSIAS